MLKMLKMTFCSRDPRMWRDLYVSLVKPHLEFTWNPYLEKDMMKIEKVQIRVSKIPYGFCNLCYEERLKRLNITSLTHEDRRARGDLIEMYKVTRVLD